MNKKIYFTKNLLLPLFIYLLMLGVYYITLDECYNGGGENCMFGSESLWVLVFYTPFIAAILLISCFIHILVAKTSNSNYLKINFLIGSLSLPLLYGFFYANT